jgi:hypothetical protein
VRPSGAAAVTANVAADAHRGGVLGALGELVLYVAALAGALTGA